MSLSNVLPQIAIFTFFRSEGNPPIRRACLKIITNGMKIGLPNIFSMRIRMLSYPWDLFESKFRMIFPIPLVENVTVDRGLSVL